MADLLEIQRDFAAALRNLDASSGARRWLAGNAALVEQRLAIYRANTAASAVKALSFAYPVVGQVVGEEFFEGLARAYHRATPSTSGDLFDYGGDFGAFLAAFPHARSLPYLPDLARLEWLVHRAYGARAARPWDPAALTSVAPEQQGMIRFDWAPGTAVIDSAFPLAHVWNIHQPGYAGDFSVDWSVCEQVLVAREGLRVTVHALGPGDAAFIAGALAGATLDTAATAALEADAGFDLGAILSRAVASNLICGLSIDGEAT
jgi:hypothetical protein